MALAFCASSSERSPTEVGHHEASDLGRLAASLDALASLSCKSHAEEADFGDGAGEVDLIALLCGSPMLLDRAMDHHQQMPRPRALQRA